MSGPDPANRLFIISGIAVAQLYASAPAGSQTTHRRHSPCTLARNSRALSSSVRWRPPAAAFLYYMGDPPQSYGAWRVTNVDADFDDEGGKTQLSIEAEVEVYGSQAQIQSIAFEATILAAT